MADVMHKPAPPSIYDRTDYLVNSDMSIPLALAYSRVFQIDSELERRTGFPQNDRAPEHTPLSLPNAAYPKAKL